MDIESTSTAPRFNPKELVWAKMKGFPPWPAMVNESGADTPVGRLPVTFFGTRETAFMKPTDLCHYMINRSLHEVPRKHKGFNDGIHEIRVAAGLELPMFRDETFVCSDSRKSPSPVPASNRIHDRRLLADAFLSGYERKRSNSASTVTRSRASSSASALKNFKKEIKRRRLDSESSGGSRRNKMISGFTDKLGNDILDHFSHVNPLEAEFPLLGDDLLGNEEGRSLKSKRSRGSSKVFEDYLLGMNHSRVRNRSGSVIDGRGTRSRLISGVSDVFDELFNTGSTDVHVAAEQLMQTLEELPSESSEERPGTPETPAPLPRPAEFCTDCGCECKIFGSRWRCSSKYCQKWNGPVDSFNRPSTSGTINFNTQRDEMVEMKPSKMTTVKKESFQDGEEPTVNIRSNLIKTNMDKKKKKPNSKELRMPKIEIKREVPPSPKKGKSVRDRIREEFDRLEKPLAAKVVKEAKRVQVISPRGDSMSPPDSPKSTNRSSDGSALPIKRASGRPKQYKVEKTPPVGKHGQRNCSFCNGQVRPQMCGGNKHRKWYGWVKSSDEIPRDLGRKGRFNSVLGGKQKNKKLREEERKRARAAAADSASVLSEDNPAGSSLSNFIAESGMDPDGPKRKGRPPKRNGLKIKLNTKERKDAAPTESAKPAKRKYVRRKDRDDKMMKDEDDGPKRAISPLTPSEMRYKPSAMEKRARWWTSEKRRIEVSPEREFQTSPADAAAAFRILSHAFRAAAVTRADEPGTVNGSLDLLMDSLIGCMAPLLSLLDKLPNTRPDPAVLQQVWNASALHLPMFP